MNTNEIYFADFLRGRYHESTSDDASEASEKPEESETAEFTENLIIIEESTKAVQEAASDVVENTKELKQLAATVDNEFLIRTIRSIIIGFIAGYLLSKVMIVCLEVA